MLIKEDSVYLKLGSNGFADGPTDGLYRDDTRHLSRYAWNVGDAVMLMSTVAENRLHQHFALVGPHRAQAVAMTRVLTVHGDGFRDAWEFRNTGMTPCDVTVALDVEGAFTDLFLNALMRSDTERPTVHTRVNDNGLTLSATATDGVESSLTLAISKPADDLRWSFTLAPGERCPLVVTATMTSDARPESHAALPSYADWRSGFAATDDGDHAPVVRQAIDDLRSLLLSTPHGPYPAAGMPWFVNIFGRDALITAMMLQRWQPAMTLTVLRLLAEHQGTVIDPFREEEPGKILHEIRRGELSRTGKIPFGRYYGSADATALFVMALASYVETTGDAAPVTELRASWEAALGWLAAHQDGSGLVQFAPSGSGLSVQSWKDSSDSMNHADGTAAVPPLSVAEVQGYAFAAFEAAAGFYRALGDATAATEWGRRAVTLKAEFHERFWIERLGTYAMALDGKGKPLEVLSSDPGHLLWCGIVPSDFAPRLVATLMSSALWSGWGLRTLGTGESRYNPVSYHNGSVWPHDTAIFGWGLARYGFQNELVVVADAMTDCARAQASLQLPELFSGMPRLLVLPPVAYTHACCPQSWAAAGLILITSLKRQF